MAVKKKSKKTTAKPQAVEPEAAESTSPGIERVFTKVVEGKNIQPNWRAFSEYVVEHGGPTIKPEHVGVVLTGYKYFQKSDSAVSAREEAAQIKADAKAERDAAREQRDRDRAAKAKEADEARAAREASKGKSSKTAKKAAAASKPAAKKATVKTTATKKTAAKKKGAAKKAAF